MHVEVDPDRVQICIDPPAKVQVLFGAVQKLPKLVQQGCPMPPQEPHEPFAHMLPAI